MGHLGESLGSLGRVRALPEEWVTHLPSDVFGHSGENEGTLGKWGHFPQGSGALWYEWGYFGENPKYPNNGRSGVSLLESGETPNSS